MRQRKNPPKVKCSRCDGRGEIEISKHLWDVLEIVRKLKKATAPQVHEHPDFEAHVVPTAVNNRLEDLFHLDLITRVKDGKAWVYSCK